MGQNLNSLKWGLCRWLYRGVGVIKRDTRSLDFNSCKVSAVRVHGFRWYMIWAGRIVGSQFGTAYLQVIYWDLYLSSGDIVKQVQMGS